MVHSEKHVGMGQRLCVMVFYVKYFRIVSFYFPYRVYLFPVSFVTWCNVALNLKLNKRLNGYFSNSYFA